MPATARAASIEIRWDPNPEPNVTSYRVYVGSAPGRYDRFIDVGTQVSFALPNAEPGKRYYLAVAAVAGSEVSEKSQEVFAIGEGVPVEPFVPVPDLSPAPAPDFGIVPEPTNPYPDPSGRGGWPPPYGARAGQPAVGLSGETCTAQSGPRCFQYAQVGPTVGQTSSLSATADGLLFFVEDKARVQLLAAGQLVQVPAYVSAGARLEQVVVDPEFARTGFVFVSESVQRRDGTLELSIVRLRFLAGSLGEAAAIVTGIPMSSKNRAPFAVPAGGVLYVAVPATGGEPSPDSERVLAFTLDGRALREPRSGGLVTGEGLPDPVSMWLADDTGLLWLAGRDRQGQPVTGVVDLTGGARSDTRIDGNPAASAGPLGVIAIPDRTVFATTPGPNGAVFAAVGSGLGAAATDRMEIVKLQPLR